MDESEVMEVADMECDVCCERTFQEREGYYYCIECGTKKEQMRAVEISAEDTFNDTTKHITQRTIKKVTAKAEETDITSWEFYNYVLRGFLEELLHMGAKPELKLMTLQVWAAYMGRMEVAFCKTNEMGLPKLSVRALARDARIIYNHKQSRRKRDRQDKRKGNLPGDERANWREWRKTKRKLDESGFSVKKGSVSEISVATNHSLKLQWSTQARKSMKKHMPLKHLDKHSVDSDGSMGCHKLHPKVKTLNFFDRNIYCLNITKLYVVLAIALNQVEDNIQLTDLMRLIDEEHLTSRYMLNYLPESVAMHGKKLLKELELGHQIPKFRFKFIRRQISHMSRFIDMNGFQKPDLADLARRYVLELSLPPEMASYVISLMDVLPPTFEPIRGEHMYPSYEARVMAYIIYALKLLFGLDDVKERAISESARIINEQLLLIADSQSEPLSLLFVYTDWMQFVELRKVLVAQYNESFARRFGIATQNGRKVDEFLSKERKQKEQEYNYNEMFRTPAMQRKQENICLIFETLLKEKYGQSTGDGVPMDRIEFQPSLTPAHTYFKRILLQANQAQEGEMSVQIPDFMQVDHTERQLGPFKNKINELAQYISGRGLNLRVEELACQENYQSVGMFRSLAPQKRHRWEYRANCDIQAHTWIEELRRKEKRPDFIFWRPVSKYTKQYEGKLKEHAERREALESDNPFWERRSAPNYLLKLNNEEVPLNDLASIQTFDERSMDPLRVPLQLPRKQMRSMPGETIDPMQTKLQALNAESIQDQEEQQKELLLKISNFDCWLLHGCVSNMSELDFQKLQTLFPCSFRWLLDTCAATIGLEWSIVYEQLLVLEVMFHHGIEDWSNHSNYLRLKYHNLNKDYKGLTKVFRDMW